MYILKKEHIKHTVHHPTLATFPSLPLRCSTIFSVVTLYQISYTKTEYFIRYAANLKAINL